ncbi:MAG: hypothetical protein PHW04_17715 [Candidatus Wallbacteria bacterium]|nr:hypothetical protein [Candidatus Wallbacteria bacterium]
MKKLLFCFLMSGLIASAEEAKITFKADNLKLDELLAKMAESCPGVNLVYPNLLEFPETPADFQDVSFSAALDQVCAPYNLEVMKTENVYVVRPRISQLTLKHGPNTIQDGGTGETADLNQEIVITKIDFPNKQIQFEMDGKTYTLKEGQTFGKRLQLIKVVSDEEVMVYYPRIIYKKHPIDK